MGKIDYNQGSRHNDYSSVLDSDSFAENQDRLINSYKNLVIILIVLFDDASLADKKLYNMNCYVLVIDIVK